MKKRIFSISTLLLSAGFMLMLNSCIEPVDLMTSDVETGGLISADKTFPYKLLATPSFDVNVSALKGPAIQTIEVYNSFTHKVSKDTLDVSEEVLLTTIDIAGANASDNVAKSFTLTYADLKEGLTFENYTLPADEGELQIGDNWSLKYVSVMADGRKVTNTVTTVIGVANFFAGDYISNVTYNHPTSGLLIDHVDIPKSLVAISADECETFMSDWTDVQLFIQIDLGSGTVTVRSNEDEWDALHTLPDGTNSYDEETGVIHIWYGYTRANGTRAFEELMTPDV
ncbi:MAG: hypothetical protein ACOYXB_04760 [Bacteroidota bacterium]